MCLKKDAERLFRFDRARETPAVFMAGPGIVEAKLEWSGGHEQSVELSGVVARHADYEKAWWVLLGASLCIFSGSASVAYYTFGVFLPEIIAATKWPGARWPRRS